jgi:flagellin
LISQVHLQRSQNDLSNTLQRLSTGLRINRGADDPAGLIASETLRAEISGIGQAIANSERASNVIATTEGALNEVAAMLVSMQDLVIGAANEGALSADEIAANQLQVDSAIQSITRIANTTTFAGLHLLNGSLGYATSGVDDSVLKDLHLNSVQFGTQDYVPVSVDVVTSAQKAGLEFQTSQIATSITIQVAGATGITDLSFASGTHASAIAFAINTVSDATGVEASYINSTNAGSGIVLRSAGYGSNAFVSVTKLTSSGDFDLVNESGTASSDTGQDAVANVNGILTQADGLDLSLQTLGLDMELTIAEDLGTGSTSFAITGGGSKFQLGPEVNSNQQVNIGIRSIAASSLGNALVGYLSQIGTGEAYSLVSGNARQASMILKESIRQVAVLRGRLGAFERNVLQTNVNSLQVALENVTSSESQIRDADFAVETSNLTRAQILTQAGTSVLAIANTTPQSVLALLGR